MSPDNNNNNPMGSNRSYVGESSISSGPEVSDAVPPLKNSSSKVLLSLREVPLNCPTCDSPNTVCYKSYILARSYHFCKTCTMYWTSSIHSYVGESSISSGPEVYDAVTPLKNSFSKVLLPIIEICKIFHTVDHRSRVRRPEVSDAVPPLYLNPTKVKSTLYDDFSMFDFLKLTREVSDTVEITNITPELESLLGIHTSQFINKFHAELTGFRYRDSSFYRFNLEKLIRKQLFKTAAVVDGIKRYDGVTAKEFSKLFSRYEPFLLRDCIIRSQMLDASCPMSLKTLDVKNDAEFDHEVDGENSQYQKRAGSTEYYRSIHSFIDQFIEKNGNTIGDEVKLDQYGMPRLRAFITLKFFQMAEESGLMRVMDSTNITDILRHFEEPLLRDCIQEIQKGPIQKELIKTFAQPEISEEEKLDQRKIKFMQKINLDGAIQGAAIVVSYVLSSSKSRVFQDVLMFALVMGITCSMLAHFLRNKESVSKVLTKLGLMGIASSVILSFAALFPQVIMSCTFGTIAILLLAYTVMMN